MAQFGERKSANLGRGYEKDPMYAYAQSFATTANNMLTESHVNYFKNPSDAVLDPSNRLALQKFFVENSFDQEGLTAQEIADKKSDMKALFENDIEALNEASNTMNFNAMVGLSLPMHKNIMMNMVFDKGAIPKAVAVSEKFTRSMERRFLVTPEGERIDMFKDQNLMTAAMSKVNPVTPIELTLPEIGSTDLVNTLGGAAMVDHLDVETYIGEVKLDGIVFEAGEVLPDENGVLGAGEVADSEKVVDGVWFAVDLRFTPGYGTIKRQLNREVAVRAKIKDGGNTVVSTIKDVLTGNIIDDRVTIVNTTGKVKAVKLYAKLDASSRTIPTCTVAWDEITEMVEIGTDTGIQTTVSPEEIKDISVLYQVNQLTKYMSLMKTVLANRKDDKIKEGLDESYKRLDSSSKFYGKFDYAAPARYALDHVEWRRKTFFEYFDAQITQMLRVLNDPNMTISVFAEPDIIRRITPTDYTYQTPANIGAVELDFTKTVVTSDGRVYQFVGSDKLRNNYEMIITLCPKNTNRIIYIIYDYQMYISNEIRNAQNFALPNICAFERWKFDSYQPVQGRLQIVNPMGIRPDEGLATVPFRA